MSKATAEQLKELLTPSDGFKCLDIDGAFFIVHESGHQIESFKTPAIALHHLRIFRKLHRIIHERAYQRGHDDGRDKGRKLAEEILNA